MSSKQTLPADILSAFCLEVSMLLKSGMPIADGIRIVLNEENSKKGKEILEQCHAGGAFADPGTEKILGGKAAGGL